MTVWRLISYINWLLVALCAASVLYCLILINGATSTTWRSLESAIKGLCLLVFLVLAGLNLLPYQWSKVVTLLLGLLALLLFGYTLTR